MQQPPSLASTHSPRMPAAGTLTTAGEFRLDRTIAERTLHNPLGPGSASAGRSLYSIYCVPCHGLSGTGDGLVPKHFARGIEVRPADLTSDAVQQHSDGWLYATITNGTQRMPAYHYELTPHERWEIVTFVRQFRSGGR
jgi:mono/diheme cytochrome c family protein